MLKKKGFDFKSKHLPHPPTPKVNVLNKLIEGNKK